MTLCVHLDTRGSELRWHPSAMSATDRASLREEAPESGFKPPRSAFQRQELCRACERDLAPLKAGADGQISTNKFVHLGPEQGSSHVLRLQQELV